MPGWTVHCHRPRRRRSRSIQQSAGSAPMQSLKRAVELQWFAVEPVLTHNYRMGMGFTLNSPDAYMGPNLAAFGHVYEHAVAGLRSVVDT